MKQSAKKQILHSLVWAAAILASSFIVKDEKQASMMLFILLAGWVASGGLNGGAENARKEIACLKKRFFGESDAPTPPKP